MSKKPLETYKIGDKVKVDRSGAGDGVQFWTIKNGYATDNCNGYKDYDFDEAECRISEYYIRPVTKSDIKLKELYEKLNVAEFEIDTDDILRQFWKGQEANIDKTVDFLNDFLHPYLNEYKNVLTIDEVGNWDAFYKKAMHTKNKYLFIVKHADLNIVFFHASTYTTMYVTSPKYFGRMWEDRPEMRKSKSVLGVYDIDIEYSDDEYKQQMVDLLKEIISEYEKSLEKGYYNIHPDYKIVDKVKMFRSFMARGSYEDHQHPIPSNYTYALRELNWVKHYVFNKGFE